MADTPKIRFKGFADAWEQRKLSEVATMHARIGWQNLRTSEFLDSGEYMLITGTDFDDGRVNYDTCHYVEKERYEQDKHIQIKNGSILITKDGTLGKVAYVQGLSMPATLNAGVFNVVIKDEKKVDGKYLFQYLKAPFLMDYVNQKATGGTIKHLNQNILVDFPVMLPFIDEQVMLGRYFETLDHLITLHQHKCDETKELKRYMLQKMFPRNGKKNPEIRFAGFTDDWEQRKLGEVFEQTAIFVNPNDEEIELWSLTVEDGLTPKSERYNREFLVKKDTNFKEVRPGDIVYNSMNMTLGAVGYNGMAKSVAVSGYYTTMIANEGYDSYYINTWLKSPQAVSLYKTFATGSLKEKQRVQFPTLSIIPVTFPTYEEQEKIGAYFARLDHLITLHQRKCDELKEVKKFMLQNMFPQKG